MFGATLLLILAALALVIASRFAVLALARRARIMTALLVL